MSSTMSFFMYGVNQRLKKDNKLVKISKMLDWSRIEKYLRKIHKNDVDPQGGPKAYDNLKMFKAILLQQWYSLSDYALEEALSLRLDFMVFTGLELGEDVPDHSTICRFRNLLIEKGLDKVLFDEINRQLEERGLKVERARGAVIDATIIESASRPRVEMVEEDDKKDRGGERKIVNEIEKVEREGNIELDGINKSSATVEGRRDPDARWFKKGKRCYFGYKGFMLVDSEDGFIDRVHVESANEAEVDKLEKLVPFIKAKRLYADKGYDSLGNRRLLRENGIKDGIMYKCYKSRDVGYCKLINKIISRHRFIVEQGFGTLKRRFQFSRSSYITKVKVEAQFRLKAMCFNLLKAVNKLIMGSVVPCNA